VTWREVATLGDAARARPWLAVEVDGTRLVLASVDGAWYAVEDRCSHAGCPFSEEAALEGRTIVCNCHGSEFDLVSGEVLRDPAEYPVRTVPARVRGDRIEVDL
jgi:nitrite reductase/ring-hydroxylating ferredoxin subunit